MFKFTCVLWCTCVFLTLSVCFVFYLLFYCLHFRVNKRTHYNIRSGHDRDFSPPTLKSFAAIPTHMMNIRFV